MRNVQIVLPNGIKIIAEEATVAEVRELGADSAPASPMFDDLHVGQITRALCFEDQRIAAIKFIRTVYGWGLKQAKDWLDATYPREAYNGMKRGTY